ncbi:heme/hemin ABC transporter substrate-binding protein [Sneathiella sp.]|jgi:iron complex transport system substrate-binding protein|uniref:heme/hemin ABC transporter substrate-binding protein n=1 Tax=Sneathiella sp. TaxID=1964365 RepID=UPI0039E4D420
MKLLNLTCQSILALFMMGSMATAETPKRLVTVGGAITEIVYALGAGHQVVGNDTTSYYPPVAASQPKVGYQRALSAEGVISLAPDLLLLSSDAGPAPVLKQLSAIGLEQIIIPAAQNMDQTFLNIADIGKVLKREKESAHLLKALRLSLEDLKAKKQTNAGRPKILFMMKHGGGPMMVAGQETAAEGIISLAGGENAVSEYSGFRPLTAEAIIQQAPDFILTTHSALQGAGGIDGILKAPGVSLTPAGRSRRVIGMDALLLLGFGPRTISAAHTLFDKIH